MVNPTTLQQLADAITRLELLVQEQGAREDHRYQEVVKHLNELASMIVSLPSNYHGHVRLWKWLTGSIYLVPKR